MEIKESELNTSGYQGASVGGRRLDVQSLVIRGKHSKGRGGASGIKRFDWTIRCE